MSKWHNKQQTRLKELLPQCVYSALLLSSGRKDTRSYRLFKIKYFKKHRYLLSTCTKFSENEYCSWKEKQYCKSNCTKFIPFNNKKSDCSHFEHRRFPKEPPFKGSCIFYSSSCCCVRYPFLFFFTLKQFS